MAVNWVPVFSQMLRSVKSFVSSTAGRPRAFTSFSMSWKHCWNFAGSQFWNAQWAQAFLSCRTFCAALCAARENTGTLPSKLSYVDYAKLYLENYMAKFTVFDEHCDASAVHWKKIPSFPHKIHVVFLWFSFGFQRISLFGKSTCFPNLVFSFSFCGTTFLKMENVFRLRQ